MNDGDGDRARAGLRRGRGWVGAEWALGGGGAGAGRTLGARAGGSRRARWRPALGALDAAGLHPRRLFGRPPAGPGLAIPAQPAAGGAWPGVDTPAGRGGASVRRRLGRAAGAIDTGHGRRAWGRWRGLSRPDGPAGGALARAVP